MRRFLRLFVDSVLSPNAISYRIFPHYFIKLLEQWGTPPAGDSYYGSRATDYDEIRQRQAWWDTENKAVKTVIESLSGIGNVLDVPCGSGRFFDTYLQNELKVTGLDASDEMLAEAEKRPELSEPSFDAVLIRGDAKNMPFPDDSFDIVVCFRFLQTIVNFGEAKEVIEEIQRVSSRYALIELDLRRDGVFRRIYPSDGATMRDRLYKEEAIQMLASKNLRVLEILGPFKAEEHHFGFLCEKAGSSARDS